MKRIVVFTISTCLLSIGILAEEQKQEHEQEAAGLNASTLSGIKLRNIGPALMSGRIADVAIDPVEPNTWYVAAGSGNLWKTTNAGTTWVPIFDNYGSYSIGCVTVDPSNHHSIWVGTGEAVSGRHVGYGDGVYRSLDGGKTFTNTGLKKTEHIAKILVDPRDSNLVYVAAQGPLWSPGGERGLYKSTDGGKGWKLILAGGPYTGVTDIAFDPRNSDIVYAATYQRHRTVWALINGGPESGIHKSTDGGLTWRELKSGLPSEDKGKIALALEIKEGGTYAFRLSSDDGSRLYVDGEEFIDHDGLHGPDPGKEGTTDLHPGKHDFRIEHFEYGGGEQVTLEWKRPGTSGFTLIPMSALSVPAGADRATAPGKKEILRPPARPRPGDGMPLAGFHPSFDLLTANGKPMQHAPRDERPDDFPALWPPPLRPSL